MLNIDDVLPNTLTRFQREIKGTNDYPYIVVEQTVIVPQGRSIRELGEAIKSLCGEVDIPDKFGMEGITYIGDNFLTLIERFPSGINHPRHICIYNLTPRHSLSLCYYLTGISTCPGVGFLESVLALQAGTIGTRIATRYATRLQEVIQRCITSEIAVC